MEKLHTQSLINNFLCAKYVWLNPCVHQEASSLWCFQSASYMRLFVPNLAVASFLLSPRCCFLFFTMKGRFVISNHLSLIIKLNQSHHIKDLKRTNGTTSDTKHVFAVTAMSVWHICHSSVVVSLEVFGFLGWKVHLKCKSEIVQLYALLFFLCETFKWLSK